MTELYISLPPSKDSPDFDGWLVQVAQYLRDYLGATISYNDLDDLPTYVNFVDRGDPAAHDITQATMTTDGAYHDLDLSSIVPAASKAVLLRVSIADDAPSSVLLIRKNGNSNDHNSAACITQVAGVYQNFDCVVFVDANRVVEYKATSTTWTAITIVVAGWWI